MFVGSRHPFGLLSYTTAERSEIFEVAPRMDMDLVLAQTSPLVFPAHTSLRTLLSVDKLGDLARAKAGNIVSTDEDDEATAEDYYFWSAAISNNQRDAYFTVMGPSSLKNYARAANDGVAFMAAHDTRRLPLGHSLYGKYTSPSGNGQARVEADFYTLKNYDANGVNSDQFYRGVKGGVIRDVSIGFYGGEWMCNICHRDMMDWSSWENYCPHIPGVEYALKDEAGNKTDEKRLCVATIDNANLSEVSAVYDGATPGASIRKATLLAEAGKLPEPMARHIESFYQNRFRLPVARAFAGASLRTPDEEDAGMTMPDTSERATTPIATEPDEVAVVEDRAVETPVDETPVEDRAVETPVAEAAPLEEQRAADPTTPESTPTVASDERAPADAETQDAEQAPTAETQRATNETPSGSEGEPGDMALATDIRAVLANAGIADLSDDPVAATRSVVQEIERLRPLADMGRRYKADLIEATLDEGVRAFGTAFPREQRSATFAKLEIDEIKGYQDEYRLIASGTFKPGRITGEGEGEGEEPVVETPKGRAYPDDAYSS